MEFVYTGTAFCWKCKRKFERATADICPECKWNYCPCCGACRQDGCTSNTPRIELFMQRELERKEALAERALELKALVERNPYVYHYGIAKCKVVSVNGSVMEVMFSPCDVRTFNLSVIDNGVFTFKHK